MELKLKTRITFVRISKKPVKIRTAKVVNQEAVLVLQLIALCGVSWCLHWV